MARLRPILLFLLILFLILFLLLILLFFSASLLHIYARCFSGRLCSLLSFHMEPMPYRPGARVPQESTALFTESSKRWYCGTGSRSRCMLATFVRYS